MSETKQNAREFLFGATLTDVRRRKDRSVTLKFETNLEIGSDDFANMDSKNGMSGWLNFKENREQAVEMPSDDIDVQQKSQSQRLRNVFYLLHQEKLRKGETALDFPSYYREEYEKIISHYKEKLPPREY